jgi:antitoxin Phd
MQTWQLQDAKARLSEVIKRAVNEGPQEITVRGEPTAVVLSAEEFRKLKVPAKPKPSFVEFMRASPLYGVEIDLTRDKRLPEKDFSFDE